MSINNFHLLQVLLAEFKLLQFKFWNTLMKIASWMLSYRNVVLPFASAIFANAISVTGHRCPLKISYLWNKVAFHRNLDFVFMQPLSVLQNKYIQWHFIEFLSKCYFLFWSIISVPFWMVQFVIWSCKVNRIRISYVVVCAKYLNHLW